MKSLFLLSWILLLSVGMLWATNPDSLFHSGNEAYQTGDYQRAIQHYEQVLESGWTSPDLCFNLGNSYLKSDQLGLAVLHYERALLQAPHDEDILVNLEIARKKQRDEINEIPEFFLTDWWNRVAMSLPALAWAILGLLFIWGGIIGLLFWQMGKSRVQRKKGFIIGVLLTMLGLIPVLFAISRTTSEKASTYAILIEREALFQSAPDNESNTIMRVHEGLKVQVLDEIGTWYKVRLGNGDQGWLPQNTLRTL